MKHDNFPRQAQDKHEAAFRTTLLSGCRRRAQHGTEVSTPPALPCRSSRRLSTTASLHLPGHRAGRSCPSRYRCRCSQPCEKSSGAAPIGSARVLRSMIVKFCAFQEQIVSYVGAHHAAAAASDGACAGKPRRLMIAPQSDVMSASEKFQSSRTIWLRM